jgi:hypothetical protein
VSSYHPEGHFNWGALSKLQALGIEVLTALDEVRHQESTKKSRGCDVIVICTVEGLEYCLCGLRTVCQQACKQVFHEDYCSQGLIQGGSAGEASPPN